MDARAEDSSTQQSRIRDLAALLALQSMWRGRELTYIATTLLDAILSLLRLDLLYLRLDDPKGGLPLEERRPFHAPPAQEIGAALLTAAESGNTVPNPLGKGELHVMRLEPRLDRENAIVIGASSRPDFPTDFESFLFRTAVEQGMVALQASRLLRDLQEANNAKAAFLATMSHELRTPLNAILGYVDLLDAEVMGALTAAQRQSLGRVKSGARHLIELIESILMFARVEAGKEEIHRAEVDACDLGRDTGDLIEPLARAKRIDFSVRCPETPIMLQTDAGKVRQILLNLLSNALKFTDSGSIRMDVSNSKQDVLFTVSDTGVGIPGGELERIFEPFRQIGAVFTKTRPGTGLGLSVSRHLARLLGGDITVASQPGRGSVFTVRLPQ